jgi:hypothetical protein
MKSMNYFFRENSIRCSFKPNLNNIFETQFLYLFLALIVFEIFCCCYKKYILQVFNRKKGERMKVARPIKNSFIWCGKLWRRPTVYNEWELEQN